MTEPTPGTPSPLPDEPSEPAAPDPAIAPDEALDADLEGNGGGEDGDADELEFDDEADEEEEAPAPEPSTVEGAVPGAVARQPGGPAVRRRGTTVAPHITTQSELAVRVTDNQSRIFVIGTVVVFAAILGWGVFAGTGGLLTPVASPTVAPSVSAAPSASAAPSVSLSPSASPAASASPSAAASASPS
jgi:hypothetical protein